MTWCIVLRDLFVCSLSMSAEDLMRETKMYAIYIEIIFCTAVAVTPDNGDRNARSFDRSGDLANIYSLLYSQIADPITDHN